MKEKHILLRTALVQALDTEDGMNYDAYHTLVDLAISLGCPIRDISLAVKAGNGDLYIPSTHGIDPKKLPEVHSLSLDSCREQIQEDLIALADGHNLSDGFKTLACQIVVDNFKKI
jgi:hypothetical protein